MSRNFLAHYLVVAAVAAASAAPAAELCRESRWPQGYSLAIAADNGVATIGIGTALAVFDVTIPGAPAPLGAVSLPDWPRAVVLRDNLAYVAADAAGLRIIDLSIPSRPREIGMLETTGDAVGLAVSGTTAAVAADGAGLRIVDVSQPETPTEIGSLVVPGNSVQDVALTGWHAYLADRNLGLRVISVAVPEYPVELGSLPNDHGVANAVVVDGHLAYVGLSRSFFNGGLRVVDVSSARNPTELGYVDTAETTYDVAVVGSLVLAAGQDDGLSVIDVSDPTAPLLRGESDTEFADRSIVVIGDRALLASNEEFRVVSFADPDLPVEEFTFPTKGAMQEATVIGSVAVVADPLLGFWVLDLSRPEAVVPIVVYRIDDGGSRIASIGSHAFVASRTSNLALGGMLVFDLSTPTQPQPLGSYPTDYHIRDIEAHQDRVLVNDGVYFYILDVSDPDAPVETGRLAMTYSSVRNISAAGDYAYLGGGDGIEVVDMSDPAAPWSVNQQVPTHGSAADSERFENQLFTVTSFELTVFDVADPASPAVISSTPIPYEGYGLRLAPPFAYVATWPEGIQIVDVSDPQQPETVGSWTVQEGVAFLTPFGHRLLAPSRAGLEVLRPCGEIFSDGFEDGDTSSWSGVTIVAATY